MFVGDTGIWSALEPISGQTEHRFLALDNAGELLVASGLGYLTLFDLNAGTKLQSIPLSDRFLAEIELSTPITCW